MTVKVPEGTEFDCRWVGLTESVENVIPMKFTVSGDVMSSWGLTCHNISEETYDSSFKAQKYYTDSWKSGWRMICLLSLGPEGFELSRYKKIVNVIPE